MDQFRELQEKVPQLAIQNDNGIGSVNSEYCYDISRAKDCYRMIGSWYIENCLYSLNCNRAKYVVDSNTVSIYSELVYECLDSQHIYHCAYLQNCQNCRDCFFGYDLKGCRDCFACFGLRQKRFHIFNEAYEEEAYRQKIAEFAFGSFAAVAEMRDRFDSWALEFPHLYANLQNCEGSSGNNLFNCKDVLGYSVFNAEYSKFIDRSDGPKNCYDLINTGGPQWCYDCVTPDDSYLVLFSAWCWKCRNVILSDNCHSGQNLFGCISLHRQKNCILNKRYSSEEYEEMCGKIVASLEREENWGGHLPVNLSPFAYNESAANEYYPLNETTVLARNWCWKRSLPDATGRETISVRSLVDEIATISESVVTEILACTKCGRNYKIIPAELEFYRRMPAPLPHLCPYCRHLQRFQRKTPTKLWKRTCANCQKQIQTTYAPERPEIIYCEDCYLKTVYT